MCSHPEDDNPHFRITEEKIFEAIFHYIEVEITPQLTKLTVTVPSSNFQIAMNIELHIDSVLYLLGLVQNDTSQEGILHGYRWSCTKGKNESAKRS